jgi:hypothetical protein
MDDVPAQAFAGAMVIALDVGVAFDQHRWWYSARLVRVRRDLAAGDLEWRDS